MEATKNEKKLIFAPGPDTVKMVQDRLTMAAAFAFLGKRAFMDGGMSDEGWEDYLREIGSPFSLDHLAEAAYEGLLKMVGDTWKMLFDPIDAIEGQFLWQNEVPGKEELPKDPQEQPETIS